MSDLMPLLLGANQCEKWPALACDWPSREASAPIRQGAERRSVRHFGMLKLLTSLVTSGHLDLQPSVSLAFCCFALLPSTIP